MICNCVKIKYYLKRHNLRPKVIMSIHKPIIYIDMDGVLVDLEANIQLFKHKFRSQICTPDMIPGVFRNAPAIQGAVEAVKALLDSNQFDCYIATSAPWNNPESASDKIWWIKKHFGDSFAKKMVITHCKHLIIGDYLIDDREVNGAKDFVGKHIHFGTAEFPDWTAVLLFLQNSI